MNSELEQRGFLAAYQDSDWQLRLKHARVGCILALILMPAGSSLDYFVYPDLLWDILEIRWICNAFIAIVFALLFIPFGKRHIRILGSIWVIAPAIAISWMIYLTEGAVSPYYAGLNLVIIIGCLLMPYTLPEALVVCGIVLALYLSACILHGNITHTPSILFNNVYFIILTAVIAAASCYYYDRRRKEEFRLRHELDARNHQLAEMDRMKSEFYANVSHELRTPLTLILGPVDDLLRKRDTLAEPVIKSLDLVKQNAFRLLRLINDLLEIVRIDAQRESSGAELRAIDLNVFVPGLVDAVRHLASAKGLTITLQRWDDSLVVQADPPRLERVLLNLLTNAVKFTESGGAITVAIYKDEGYGIITVEDTGVGIPESSLPYIFDRFRQVDGSATRAYRGVGLGLALARELVEEQRGTMAVSSEIGKGTLFQVGLLLSDQPVPTASAAASVTPSVATNDPLPDTLDAADRFDLNVSPTTDQPDVPTTGSGEHLVLVVDDEPDMRKFLVSVLAKDYRVCQAADGEQAMAMARERPPNLIVLDLMLPGIDGLDICRQLRQESGFEDVKIILLTARADEQSKLEALQRGADDFLTKLTFPRPC